MSDINTTSGISQYGGTAEAQSLQMGQIDSATESKIAQFMADAGILSVGSTGNKKSSDGSSSVIGDLKPSLATPESATEDYISAMAKDIESMVYVLMALKNKQADDSIEGAQGEIDASMTRKVNARKIRQEKLEERIDEQREAQAKAEKAGALGDLLPIANIVTGIAIIVAAVALTIASGGLLAPMAGYVIAGGAMLAVQGTVQASMGQEKYQSMMETLGTPIAKTLEGMGMDEEQAKSWGSAAIQIAMSLAIAGTMLAGGPMALVGIGGMMAGEAAKGGVQIAKADVEMEAAAHEHNAAQLQAEAERILKELIFLFGEDEELMQKLMKTMFEAKNKLNGTLSETLQQTQQNISEVNQNIGGSSSI